MYVHINVYVHIWLYTYLMIRIYKLEKNVIIKIKESVFKFVWMFIYINIENLRRNWIAKHINTSPLGFPAPDNGGTERGWIKG